MRFNRVFWTSAVAAGLAVASTAAPAQRVAEPDWNSLREEGVAILAQYLRINTSNPPGNELEAARFLKSILDREGIEATILDTAELGAGRANLYARLKGSGAKKAIALVHHMDVVPVARAYWSVDPFGGVVKDGYIWGRGAIDMKSQGIIQLMAMVALKRSGVPLDRDIVYIANADEELGSTGGIVFTERHPDLLRDVEYLITEGANSRIVNGRVEYFAIGVAEKRTFWQHLVVKGIPSHGSRPTKDNPVPKLVAALDRIAQWETPLHPTPGVVKYFHDIAGNYTGRQRAWLLDVTSALRDSAARAWITSDVYWNAALRNTISLTGLQGSSKTNVIPAEASADLDIRLLPDQDPAQFLAELQRVAGDTSVHFSTVLAPKTPLENPVDTDLFRAIERAFHDRDPNAIVTTPMFTAATDRPTYRKLGIITYGLEPILASADEIQHGMHGNDERLAVTDIGWGIHFMYDVLRNAQ